MFGSVLQTSNVWLSAMNNQAIIAAANAAILVDTSDENRKKRKGAEGASAPPHDIHPNDLLNVLIKDHLFFKQEAQPVVDANSLVVLFKEINVAKKFAQSASSWHDQEPAQVPTGQKRQPHPWGPKKVFLMIILLDMLEKAAKKMLDSPAKQTAVGAIQEMSKWTPLQLDQSIHTFKSKFRAPIANRTWKFDLVIGALAPMRLRELFTELLASFIDPDKTIVIAVKRSQQPETEKKLWATVSKKK